MVAVYWARVRMHLWALPLCVYVHVGVGACPTFKGAINDGIIYPIRSSSTAIAFFFFFDDVDDDEDDTVVDGDDDDEGASL